MKLLNTKNPEEELAKWAEGVVKNMPQGVIMRDVKYDEESGTVHIYYDYTSVVSKINIEVKL